MKPVGPAPVFTQNLRDEKIKIGDTLTLTCQGLVCIANLPHVYSLLHTDIVARVDISTSHTISFVALNYLSSCTKYEPVVVGTQFSNISPLSEHYSFGE